MAAGQPWHQARQGLPTGPEIRAGIVGRPSSAVIPGRRTKVPKKSSPVRSKKYDHPRDTAAGLRIPTEVKTPKHPKKSDKK